MTPVATEVREKRQIDETTLIIPEARTVMTPVATEVRVKRQIDETALITGSEAIAVACKLADVDVITANIPEGGRS